MGSNRTNRLLERGITLKVTGRNSKLDMEADKKVDDNVEERLGDVEEGRSGKG